MDKRKSMTNRNNGRRKEQYIKDREFFKKIFDYNNVVVGVNEDSIELIGEDNVKTRFFVEALNMRDRFIIQEFKELVSERTRRRDDTLMPAEYKEKADLLSKLYKDPLTKTSNRLYFEEMVKPVFKSGDLCCFTIFDIDDFKKINDTFGHDKGDMVLMLFARIGEEHFGDAFCRYGGEEFVMVTEESKEQTAKQAEKFIHAVKNRLRDEFKHMSEEEIWEITCSCGIAEFPGDAENFRDLYHVADKRLYQAKRRGKNMVVYGEKGVKNGERTGI